MEVAILGSITGPQARELFAGRIAACLPSAAAEVQPEAAVQRLEALRCSDAGRLAPRAGQSLLTHSTHLAGAGCEGNPVAISVLAADEHSGAGVF